jgi:muramoyltetrapeptide carboxypeptidase
MFSQLYISEMLNKISGIIIGTFSECTGKHFEAQETIKHIIEFWCKRINVPFIKNFPYGHIKSRYVLPIGQIATLDASNCKLEITFC